MKISSSLNTYAVIGSTGNCGRAIIEVLLNSETARIHAYCRDRGKLRNIFPRIEDNKRVKIFQGALQDIDLFSECINGCKVAFLCVSTNDNIPGCCLSQETAVNVIKALRAIRQQHLHQDNLRNRVIERLPKLILLSSGTIDETFARCVPRLLLPILLRSASHVYHDLEETEKLLRAESDWITSIFVMPGALSVDAQRGHALSLVEQHGTVSYLDLAAAMIEAGDEPTGCYDGKNVSVICTSGEAKFPSGTLMCILLGLVRHYFPWLHPYLPLGTGPK